MTLGVANVPSIGMAPASLADNYQTIDICRGCSTAGLPLSLLNIRLAIWPCRILKMGACLNIDTNAGQIMDSERRFLCFVSEIIGMWYPTCSYYQSDTIK